MENILTVEKIIENYSGTLPSMHTVMWSLFAVILFYTAVHAVIFVYHWHKYNIAPGPFLKLTYLVYFSGIGVFTSVMFLSLIAILT